jgi:hypothetical protein
MRSRVKASSGDYTAHPETQALPQYAAGAGRRGKERPRHRIGGRLFVVAVAP